MGKYFVIRQTPPSSNYSLADTPWKNSVPVAFSFCVYFLQQIPINEFHFTSSSMIDMADLQEAQGFEVVFTRTVQIAVPISQPLTAFRSGSMRGASQPGAIKEVKYHLTINATPLLPLANDLEPMFWFLEEVTKAEYENGVRLIKLPALTSHLNAEALEQ